MNRNLQQIFSARVPVMLAPLEDITDSVFRRLCKRMGADVVFTEFISSEGLIRDAWKSHKKLVFHESERPIAVQIFGYDIAAMEQSARIASEVEPDFIDINFGCPVRKVVEKGAGAALLKDLDKMQRLTEAVVNASSLPITVKTRLGWDEKSKNIVEAALRLQDAGISALCIHGRTRSQFYGGQADWSLIGEVKNHPSIHIPVIGNGDIVCAESAQKYLEQYGVDGLMIGRAAVGNPWIFQQCRGLIDKGDVIPFPGVEERIAVCREHIQLSMDEKGMTRALHEMRQHYTNYFKGLPGIKTFRNRLVTASEHNQLMDILDEILVNYAGFNEDNTCG